jgi:hypothetical protein
MGAVTVSEMVGTAVSWDICSLAGASTVVSATGAELGSLPAVGAQPEMTKEKTITMIGKRIRVIKPP